MFKGKPVLAIIPARSGSKGIPGKNLYRLNDEPLLERTIKFAKLIPQVDRVVVSTDDPEMHDIACRHGVNAPTLRPTELASDDARTLDVVLNLLSQMNIEDHFILLLQTTAPLRTLADAKNLFDTLGKGPDNAQAVVSLTKHQEPHPNKLQKLENGFVQSFLGTESGVPRQQLPEVYRPNGAFYLIHQDVLQTDKTFLPSETVPYIMPEECSINLDTPMDLILLEALLEKGHVQLEIY